jgi:protein phosphatase PTC7
VQVLATNLIEYAKICQNSTTKQSPFEREAARYGIHFPGGKIDDVATVCCLVIER